MIIDCGKYYSLILTFCLLWFFSIEINNRWRLRRLPLAVNFGGQPCRSSLADWGMVECPASQCLPTLDCSSNRPCEDIPGRHFDGCCTKTQSAHLDQPDEDEKSLSEAMEQSENGDELDSDGDPLPTDEIPYPGFEENVFRCLKQTNRLRRFCLYLITSPYPLLHMLSFQYQLSLLWNWYCKSITYVFCDICVYTMYKHTCIFIVLYMYILCTCIILDI